MTQTMAEVGIYLPSCLSAIVRTYFETDARDPYSIAEAGEYEACLFETNMGPCFQGACRGGHLAIVELAINRWPWGYTIINEGLARGCLHGHLDIVKLMIARGADDWDRGLRLACKNGNRELMSMMVDRGASRCHNCQWAGRGPHPS